MSQGQFRRYEARVTAIVFDASKQEHRDDRDLHIEEGHQDPRSVVGGAHRMFASQAEKLRDVVTHRLGRAAADAEQA